jgi:hypothetical protein
MENLESQGQSDGTYGTITCLDRDVRFRGEPILSVPKNDREEREIQTGKEEIKLSLDEKKLWLQVKLEELNPGYTDGGTQKKESSSSGFYQEEN